MSATSCTAQSERLGVIVDGSSVSGTASTSVGRHRFDRARRNGGSAAPPLSGGAKGQSQGQKPDDQVDCGVILESRRGCRSACRGEARRFAHTALYDVHVGLPGPACCLPHCTKRSSSRRVEHEQSSSHHRPATRYRRIRQGPAHPSPTDEARYRNSQDLYAPRSGLYRSPPDSVKRGWASKPVASTIR